MNEQCVREKTNKIGIIYKNGRRRVLFFVCNYHCPLKINISSTDLLFLGEIKEVVTANFIKSAETLGLGVGSKGQSAKQFVQQLSIFHKSRQSS